ncbi:MAG: UDP-2,3-diacylglucosamine diphosphatase LpxI [Paracoccaceae bacterium]|nr:UDP-2,3-diacylglucosamine diphosphatase LpxI [Paracoccaceae bacterium]
MLALIAGQGRLPQILVARLRAENRPFIVLALEGYEPDLPGVDIRRFRLEHLGTILSDLAGGGVDTVCMAGAVRRPRFDPAAIDAATAPFIPRVLTALQTGDDSALRAVISIFEDVGMTVVSAQEIAPDLLPKSGFLGKVTPTKQDQGDAERGHEVLQILGNADIGQSCVVAAGQVIAVEASPGTDWMLRSLSENPPEGVGGGVFCKAPKPGQDRRADLPVIGPETVNAASAAGLNGLMIEAGGVMVLDREETITCADATGLFLWVRQP